MMSGLKPYPAYKDSGAPWLGEVPEHWEVSPLGRIGRFSKGNGGTKADEVSEGVPCIRYGDLYTQHQFFITSSRSFVTAERADDYTPVSYGDVLFAASGETLEEIGKSAVSLIESKCCCGGDVLLFRPNREMIPRFLGYTSDCPQSVRQKACMGRGVTVMHIYADRLKYLWVALPSVPEQAAIVRFLDHADRRIRRYIRAKQKLIKLLEEQKQAIIHRAVTRGLDPNVRLKPSGVAWLGDVPDHWAVGPLKRFVARRPGAIKAGPFGSQLTAAEMTAADIKVYTQRNVIDRDLNLGLNYVSISKFEELRAFEVFPGDVLVTSRGTIGRTALVTDHSQRGVLHPCLLRVHPDNTLLLPGFLMALIQDSQLLPQQLTLLSNATTIDVIYSGTLANVIIPVPPVDQQRDILEYIAVHTSKIAQAISTGMSELDLLREYRSRLIADVVTGKVDVREAAAHLPEEADQPEPLDEIDEVVEGHEITDETDLGSEVEEAAA